MGKLWILLDLVLGVLVASLAFATGASAETTLLAEWLINGAAVTTSTSTLSTLSTFKLGDTTFGSTIECSYKTEGTVGNDGVDSTTKILNGAGAEKSLASPLTVASGECKTVSGCSTTSATEFAPEELPWATLLVLDEGTGKFLDIVTKVAYAITCTIFGIKETDTCTIENGGFELIAAVEGAEAKGKVEPLASCSIGGAEKGEVEFLGANHLQNLAKEAVIPSSGA